MNEEKALLEAEFEPKLRTYWFLQVLLVFAVTVVGIVLTPFWVLGWGQWWAKRRFENQRCTLYERALVVKQGVFFKVEKTIPLDKIQDLTVREGPLLRAIGLRSLKIETAGQSAEGQAEADLVGVVDPRDFRDSVLSQKDRMLGLAADPRTSELEPVAGSSVEDLLTEIRDLLRTIAARRG